MNRTLSTKERLENAIKHEPERYIVTRNEYGELTEVQDKDSGYLWRRFFEDGEEHWIWVS